MNLSNNFKVFLVCLIFFGMYVAHLIGERNLINYQKGLLECADSMLELQVSKAHRYLQLLNGIETNDPEKLRKVNEYLVKIIELRINDIRSKQQTSEAEKRLLKGWEERQKN